MFTYSGPRKPRTTNDKVRQLDSADRRNVSVSSRTDHGRLDAVAVKVNVVLSVAWIAIGLD